MTGVAIELDVLGDSTGLWEAWLDDAARVLPVRGSELSRDRATAAGQLDDSGAGNWRVLLSRFAEDHGPRFLRPDAATSASVRRLAGAGVTLGVFTDAPAELAAVVLAHTGAARRVSLVETGERALERLLDRLGPDANVVLSREDLHRSVS